MMSKESHTSKRPRSTDTLVLSLPTRRQEEDDIILSVDLDYHNKRDVLWYRFPAKFEPLLTTTSDPFVLAALFPAMENGLDIRVEGPVTQRLLENAERFMEVWNKWDPKAYQKCNITACSVADTGAQKDEHVAFMFSGGLDSCHTAWKHTQSTSTQFQKAPQSAIFVLGFDIPLEDAHYFFSYLPKAREFTDSIGAELIPLQFNFRELVGNWEQAHGTALASCLHLFSGRFSTGLIASSHAYDSLRFPWGSNPLTDPLLSSDRLRIINDGGDYSRWEKAAAIADWEPAMAHLRVCYKGEQRDRNCGVCSNCLLAAIAFAIAGKTIPPALNVGPEDVTIQKLFHVDLEPIGIVRINEMIAYANHRGYAPQWLDDLRACAQHHQELQAPVPRGRLKRLWNRLKTAQPAVPPLQEPPDP